MIEKFFSKNRKKALGTALIDIFKGSAIAILVGDVFIKLGLPFKILSMSILIVIGIVGLAILPKEE